MSDFLHFLNTANAESLENLSGVNASLAKNLIAARPFDSIEDCLKVHGMGKNLLARAQASFEEADIAPEERALIPVGQQDAPEEIRLEKKPPMEEIPPKTKPSFGSRLGQAILWFFRALLRLILIVLVIGGIGAAIYYGAPLINERFVAPVKQNAARVEELETEIGSLQLQLTEINSQLIGINSQLTGIKDQLSETNSRIDSIQQSVEGHTASLEKLEVMQATLDAQLKESNDKTLLALKHEVMMTRALDMLARARLYLAQSNFGLAKNDIQSARDLFVELQADVNDKVLSESLTRLDLVLGNLPDFPVIASGDLEIAWQILMTGESPATATPEPASTMTVTPNPTSATPPSATPTP